MGDLDASVRHSDQMASGSSKRLRSWDVDVSLDNLVEWDSLEQIMAEIPDPMSGPAPASAAPGPAMQANTRTFSSGSSYSGRPSSDLGKHLPAVGASNPGSHRAFPGLVPGAWPLGGVGDMGQLGHTSQTQNAAALAASFYPSWQQGLGAGFPLQALPMERGVSWGAELLPFLEQHDDVLAAAGLTDPPGGMDGGAADHMDPSLFSSMHGAAHAGVPGGDASSSRPVHKQRFVWTAELHRRFEAAVNTLGVDQAKPQAISQLMNCEGEGAPTRQNIKSHLQKYRLLIQKRQKTSSTGEGAGGCGDAAGDASSVGTGGGVGGVGEGGATDVQSELEQHLARQEMNLRVQMDLQTKLHRQLLVQRQLQHQLEHCFPSQGDPEKDKQRYQATLQLKNSLRERLTTHVMLQQEMLQHLDALVSSEVSKTEEHTNGGENETEEPEGGGASALDTSSEAADTTTGSDKADE